MLCDLSFILVVDVVSTGRAVSGDAVPPASEQGDIMEIGIASVDTGSLRIHQLDDLLVNPALARNAAIVDVPPDAPEPAGGSLAFSEVCRIIKRRYLAPNCTWASWTNLARVALERQCKAQTIPYPFGPTHIDVGNLFALAHHLPQHVDVAEALERAKLPPEGSHQRAHHHARNVARLLISILQRCR